MKNRYILFFVLDLLTWAYSEVVKNQAAQRASSIQAVKVGVRGVAVLKGTLFVSRLSLKCPLSLQN